jgi:hypothetical protein
MNNALVAQDCTEGPEASADSHSQTVPGGSAMYGLPRRRNSRRMDCSRAGVFFCPGRLRQPDPTLGASSSRPMARRGRCVVPSYDRRERRAHLLLSAACPCAQTARDKNPGAEAGVGCVNRKTLRDTASLDPAISVPTPRPRTRSSCCPHRRRQSPRTRREPPSHGRF